MIYRLITCIRNLLKSPEWHISVGSLWWCGGGWREVSHRHQNVNIFRIAQIWSHNNRFMTFKTRIYVCGKCLTRVFSAVSSQKSFSLVLEAMDFDNDTSETGEETHTHTHCYKHTFSCIKSAVPRTNFIHFCWTIFSSSSWGSSFVSASVLSS